MGEHDDDLEVPTTPEAASTDAARIAEALDRIARALAAIAGALEARTARPSPAKRSRASVKRARTGRGPRQRR